MGVNIRGRSFLTLLDFTPEEINYLIDLAADFKRMKAAGIAHKWLPEKQIVLLFEKTSTRTRCAFEVGARDLGMGVTFLDQASSQMGKKESLADTAKVLGRMYDGIEYRGYSQAVVEALAKYSGVPVWNGLTDDFHPTQMLADMLTVREEFGSVRGRKLTFFGDARNNVATRSWSCVRSWGCTSAPAARRSLCPRRRLSQSAALSRRKRALCWNLRTTSGRGRRTVTPCIRIYGFPWASPQNCGMRA